MTLLVGTVSLERSGGEFISVLLILVLLQETTINTCFSFFKIFLKNWNNCSDLVKFPLDWNIWISNVVSTFFFFFFIPPLPTFWIFVSNILVLLCRNYFFLSLKTFILLPQLNHLFRFCLNKSNFQYAHISHFLN